MTAKTNEFDYKPIQINQSSEDCLLQELNIEHDISCKQGIFNLAGGRNSFLA